MVVIDSNVLLYAYMADDPHHVLSRNWLSKTLEGPESIGLSSVTILSFLRISTRHGIWSTPASISEAVAIMGTWIKHERVVPVEPGPRHWRILSELLVESQSKGNLVNDAHLAALAIENGAALCSFDRDFRRFPKLRLIIPE